MEEDIDRFKKIVDNIFDSFESSSRKEEVVNFFSVQVDNVPAGDEEFAKAKALDELEQIRLAFLEFQDKVHDLTMFNYMTSSFEQFAEYASDLTEVIEDNIDEDKLTPDSLRKYRSIKKLRAQILANIYRRYKNDK